MKNSFFRWLLLAAGFFLTTACSKTTLYPTQWQQTQVAKEAIPVSWEQHAEVDPSGKISYAFSNDDRSLYVFFRTADRAAQLKMLRGGVKLSVDTLGKKEEHLSLLFPYRLVTPQEGGSRQGTAGGAITSRPVAVNATLEELDQVWINGFSIDTEGGVSRDELPGFDVRMQMDEAENMYYWAVIPIDAFPVSRERMFDSQRPMAMNISLVGVEMGQDMRQGMPGERAGGRPAPGRQGGTEPGWPGDRRSASPLGPRMSADIGALQATDSFVALFHLVRE